MPSTTDVLIVGGGPAGLATAIALRQRKIRCMVIDAGLPGIDKACGEGLMPETLHSLAELGVELRESDGAPFLGISFLHPEHRVEACFPGSSGLGVRRTVLHERLADHASGSGATLRWQSRVKLLDRRSALVNGVRVEFRWLIGADGHASSVRRWAGLDKKRVESRRFGFRQHYAVRPWSSKVEVYWGEGAQIYVTPVGDSCVGVALVTRNEGYDRHDLLKGFPELAERLRGATRASQQRGAVTATLKLRRVADDTVALVGDASGSVDAITGDGLGLAFRQALALSVAIESGSLRGYDAAHRRIGRLPHLMGQMMLMMDRWPPIRRRALSVLASHPPLFSDLLAVHLGVKSVPAFVWNQGPALTLGLLRQVVCR